MNEERREFPGVDRKERMQLISAGLPIRPPEERVKDFEGVLLIPDADTAIMEAQRCIHCPDPAPCFKACPANNDISLAMWHIEKGKFLEAANVYRQTSSMPEICSLVCPHDQLCQGACPRGRRGEPVLTGLLEAFAIQQQRQVGEYKIPVGGPTGKNVAIIGAGCAGISCAEQLVRKGHQITILDAKPAPGGLLTYGIPNFKLPKEYVFDLWGDLVDAGIEFQPNTFIGKDKNIDELFNEGYDAVFVGVGANVDAPMRVEGEDIPGVINATEFLIRSNVPDELLPENLKTKLEVGDRVAVIGGGDTAADCLRSAVRLGAEEVFCLYRRTEAEMPGNSHDRELATDEGAEYRFLIQPIKFIAGDDGKLAAVECIKMELTEPDDSGRPRPIPIEDTNFIIEVDTIIKALGYWPDETIAKTTPKLQTHKWGLIVTDIETGKTSREGVFAGGDGVTGPDLVVTAMVAGRKAAVSIHEYLT
ncbi:MAG: NAD(P)-dependent oxidoreductase [Anaerolineales bacterium]|nr:NAD(P)-dependent oxidoreductase [Chloroflexota bacterium]MBL6983004.1 NAD(P)-dependent oxidoreductase [Anaerolineales bacterium]